MNNNQRNWIPAIRANEKFGHLRFKIRSTKEGDKHTSEIDEELVDYVDVDEFNRVDVNRVPLFVATRYGILPNIDEISGFNTKTKIIAVIHKNIYSGCIYNLSLYYFPIQIVKLKCKALSIKGFRGCVFIWATTGQQNPLKQVQVQHKEKKKCCLV